MLNWLDSSELVRLLVVTSKNMSRMRRRAISLAVGDADNEDTVRSMVLTFVKDVDRGTAAAEDLMVLIDHTFESLTAGMYLMTTMWLGCSPLASLPLAPGTGGL